jgi:hypothetical protein
MHKNSIACTTRIDYLLGNSEEPTRMASSRAFRSGVHEDSIGFGDTGDLLGCNATESLASVPPLGATPSPRCVRCGGAPCPLRQRGLRLGTCRTNLPRLLNPFRPNWKSPFAPVWTRQSPTAWCWSLRSLTPRLLFTRHGVNSRTLPDPTDKANLLLTHGRGLRFMQALMDDVGFEDNGRIVRMRKWLRCISDVGAARGNGRVPQVLGGRQT